MFSSLLSALAPLLQVKIISRQLQVVGRVMQHHVEYSVKYSQRFLTIFFIYMLIDFECKIHFK